MEEELAKDPSSLVETLSDAPLVAIPRHAWDSAEALALVDAGEPVVLLASGFLQPAVDRWTLDYLVEHAGEDNAFAVFRSAGDFLYTDGSEARGGGGGVAGGGGGGCTRSRARRRPR